MPDKHILRIFYTRRSGVIDKDLLQKGPLEVVIEDKRIYDLVKAEILAVLKKWKLECVGSIDEI